MGLALASAAPAAAQTNGATLFAQNCSACHQLTGKGIIGAFPALDGDKLVQGPPKGPALVVLNGRGGMPTFRNDLSDAQIAQILSYVRSAWSNHAPPVDVATIAGARGAATPNKASTALQAH